LGLLFSINIEFREFMRIIPAIDLIDGQCVRLTQGDYTTGKVYHSDPLEVAQYFESQGAKYLHLVDLDGAKAGKVVNLAVLEKIALHTRLRIDFGGGIQSDDDIQKVFDSGAYQITGGSIAVKKPDTFLAWIERYSAEKIILGADVRQEQISVSGWQETTSLNLFDFLAQYIARGIQYVICTDIQRDGLLQGSSTDLYKKILERFPDIKLIASGGVSDIEELAMLKSIGLHGAIIGKALYENKLDWQTLQSFL
jgi:phosphoribosylformimino-5-aminoimidazole carboxamide ribotide isomerase